uniref:Venom polypeptide n=1 Tax=Dolopus genitalis TaxID=2488630 RepID=A0A3G5BID9_DOLGE|nr:venom polypeptide [Dolopus genitalis]
MARFHITLACILLATACAAAPEHDQIGLSVEVIDDITEYLAKYPESEITPLRVVVSPIPPFRTRYVLGTRVKGDRVLAIRNDNVFYPTRRDIRLDLHYPQYGTGGIVTLIDIAVEQSSDLGRAYIVAGGIGQRQIKFVVEARDVYHLSTNTTIYGY